MQPGCRATGILRGFTASSPITRQPSARAPLTAAVKSNPTHTNLKGPLGLNDGFRGESLQV